MTTSKSMTALLLPLAVSAVVGCNTDPYMMAQHPNPIGTLSDPVWKAQEANAEDSDFVVHEHEFIGNSARLNPKGEDHVKQIAARLLESNIPVPVAVEPSSMSRREGDRYGFAVHNDPELDDQRRRVVVASLLEMGVTNAPALVNVSPTYTHGYEANESQRVYNQFINPGRFGGGFGGFGGGGGGGF